MRYPLTFRIHFIYIDGLHSHQYVLHTYDQHTLFDESEFSDIETTELD